MPGSITFDGSTQYGAINLPSWSQPLALSLLCWFKTSDTTSLMMPINVGTSVGSSDAYQIRLSGGKVIGYAIAQGGTTLTGPATTSTSYTANAWQSAVVTFSTTVVPSGTTTVAAYLNGGGKGTAGPTTMVYSSSGMSVYLARYNYSSLYFFNGSLAYCTAILAVLSDEEILRFASGEHPARIRPSVARLFSYYLSDPVANAGVDRGMGSMGANIQLFSTPTAGDAPPIIPFSRSRLAYSLPAAGTVGNLYTHFLSGSGSAAGAA